MRDYKSINGSVKSLGQYYSRQREKTSFSKQIIQYKEGNEQIIDMCVDKVVRMLSSRCDYYGCIVRALGRDELQPDYGRPLDYLGSALEYAGIGSYLPETLSKRRKSESLRSIAHKQRQNHVQGNYRFNKYYPLGSSSRVLIIDDVYTTGSTTRDIARAIRHVVPNVTIDVFSLARSAV